MFHGTDNTQSSSSFMLYLISTEFKNRGANATVCQPLGVRCSNAHPKPLRDASHFIRVSSSGLKCSVKIELFFMLIRPEKFCIFLKKRSEWVA